MTLLEYLQEYYNADATEDYINAIDQIVALQNEKENCLAHREQIDDEEFEFIDIDIETYEEQIAFFTRDWIEEQRRHNHEYDLDAETEIIREYVNNLLEERDRIGRRMKKESYDEYKKDLRTFLDFYMSQVARDSEDLEEITTKEYNKRIVDSMGQELAQAIIRDDKYLAKLCFKSLIYFKNNYL